MLYRKQAKKQENKKTIAALTFIFLFFYFFIFSPEASHAQSLLQDSTDAQYSSALSTEGTGSLGNCFSDGSCQLNDFVTLVVRVAEIILGIVGSLALLFFVYGGVTWILSAGVSENVAKGKTIVQNALIGLVIVFASWTIINFVMLSLGYSNTGFFGAWFSTP